PLHLVREEPPGESFGASERLGAHLPGGWDAERGCGFGCHGDPFDERSRLIRAWLPLHPEDAAGRLGHRGSPGLETTVWRTGRGAGALAVLVMLAAETEAAGVVLVRQINMGWGCDSGCAAGCERSCSQGNPARPKWPARAQFSQLTR